MAKTKKTKKTARKSVVKKSARKTPKQKNVYDDLKLSEESGYDDALLRNIIEDGSHSYVSEDALDLVSALSSITPALRKLSYNHGSAVGKELYRLFATKKRYRWHMESIADLVAFFEMVGYKYVTYKLLTNNIEISIHKNGHQQMDSKIHNFEAGIIAGFLTAASGENIRVEEKACAVGGAEACRYATSLMNPNPDSTKIEEIVGILKKDHAIENICAEYHMLSISPLMRREYASSLGAIVFGIGSQALGETNETEARRIAKAVKLMNIFGLGNVTYTAKPRKVEVIFNGVRAKKEFVEISIRFLSGVLTTTRKEWTARVRYLNKSGAYKAIVKEVD